MGKILNFVRHRADISDAEAQARIQRLRDAIERINDIMKDTPICTAPNTSSCRNLHALADSASLECKKDF
jgi:hypothetical protein